MVFLLQLKPKWFLLTRTGFRLKNLAWLYFEHLHFLIVACQWLFRNFPWGVWSSFFSTLEHHWFMCMSCCKVQWLLKNTIVTLKRWLWKLKWPHQAIISLALGSFILLYPGQLFCTCPLPVSNTSSAILIFNWQVSFMLHWENRSNKQPNLNPTSSFSYSASCYCRGAFHSLIQSQGLCFCTKSSLLSLTPRHINKLEKSVHTPHITNLCSLQHINPILQKPSLDSIPLISYCCPTSLLPFSLELL